jgi:hypothetical protein
MLSIAITFWSYKNEFSFYFILGGTQESVHLSVTGCFVIKDLHVLTSCRGTGERIQVCVKKEKKRQTH